jgi:hypothetical protein
MDEGLAVEKSRLVLTLVLCCLLAGTVGGCATGSPSTTAGESTTTAAVTTASSMAGSTSTTSAATSSTAATSTATPAAVAGTWTELKPAGAVPPARSSFGMVYNQADAKLIVFGGWETTTDFGDTWAYDPAANSWTDLKPGGSKPAARHDHAMAYDPDTGKVILFGGTTASTAEELADTWAYDPAANTWTEMKPAGDVPAGRVDHCMAYDPIARKVILFGGSSHGGRQGDIWAYGTAANAWTKLTPNGATPAARYGCPLVFDPDLGKTVLLGGSDGHFVTMHETWTFDSAATAWTKLSPTGAVPPGRAHFAMAYGPGNHRMVVFGGEGVTPLDDTWGFDPATDAWSKVDVPGGAPAPRMYPAMVYAAESGAFILFGGSDGKTVLNDTWSFSPAP